MYASESVTQVLKLVQHMLALFSTLAYSIYDKACGAARTLARTLRDPNTSGPQPVVRKRHATLHCVVDRLHLRDHAACCDASSGWFVPGVGPADHALLGSIRRLPTNLSPCRPLASGSVLCSADASRNLVAAHAHKVRHTCEIKPGTATWLRSMVPQGGSANCFVRLKVLLEVVTGFRKVRGRFWCGKAPNGSARFPAGSAPRTGAGSGKAPEPYVVQNVFVAQCFWGYHSG